MSALGSRYVTVQLAGLGGLPAVVEADESDAVRLALSVRPPAGLVPALARPAIVECVSPRGIQRVRGRVDWDAARPDELRVRREQDEIVQRRRAVRVDAVVPAVLIAVRDGEGRATTTTVNVSSNGLLVRDPIGLQPGERAQVELELDASEPPVHVEGGVVRTTGDHIGLQIEAMSRADRDRIARYVFERQRVELRLGSRR